MFNLQPEKRDSDVKKCVFEPYASQQNDPTLETEIYDELEAEEEEESSAHHETN